MAMIQTMNDTGGCPVLLSSSRTMNLARLDFYFNLPLSQFEVEI